MTLTSNIYDYRFDTIYVIYHDSDKFIGAVARQSISSERYFDSLSELPAHIRSKVEYLLCLSSPIQQ